MSVEKKPLNKIIREKKGNKKFKVFVKDKSTNKIKLIRFGDASFNARMGGVLKNVKGQKTLSPAYWSLKAWNT